MNRQRGQGSVELVLLAPLMMVFLFLIFEFGRVFGSWLIITNSGREGARVAITQNCDNFHTDSTAGIRIRNRVRETAQPFLTINDSNINIERVPQGFEVMARITVSTRLLTLPLLTGDIPYVGRIWNGNPYIDLTAFSTMRCE